jgi:hypothetical protein
MKLSSVQVLITNNKIETNKETTDMHHACISAFTLTSLHECVHVCIYKYIRSVHIYAEILTDRQTDRKTDRQTDMHTYALTSLDDCMCCY